jgi:hypothetical protein
MEIEFLEFLKSKRVLNRFMANLKEAGWVDDIEGLFRYEPIGWVNNAFPFKNDRRVHWGYLSSEWGNFVIREKSKIPNGELKYF